MLTHWVIVAPRNRDADHRVPRRLRAALGRHLYYKPDDVVCHRHASGVWTIGMSVASRLWGMDVPWTLEDEDFVVVAGTPTLESAPAGGLAPIPSRLKAWLDHAGIQHVFENAGGTYSIGTLDSGGIAAFADFSGYHSCCYLSTQDYVAVGNLPGLVGAFRCRFPDVHDADIETLGWLAATTMVIGDRTAFKGVRRLRTGHRLRIRLGERLFDVDEPAIAPLSPIHFSPLENHSIEAIDFGAAVETFGNRIRWCRDQGIRFRSHLTGGRDTRAVVGVLARNGLLDAVPEFITNGSDRNGDVMIARRLAGAVGVAERHSILRGSKSAIRMSTMRLVEALTRCAFVFSGQLTPFDGRLVPATRRGRDVMLMGGGGEIYRQEWGNAGVLAGPDRAAGALNLFCRFDRLDLVDDAYRAYCECVVEQELDYLASTGVVNLTGAFYLEERLANWGCAHFSNSTSAQFPLLLDFALARSVFALHDVGEDVHFEMMRHCDEALLDVPFLNHRWAPKTEERARRLGLATEPLRVEVARNFPWQFDCYRRFRDALIDFCIDLGGALHDVIPVSRLRTLRCRPVEPFSSAHVKMLFGLVAAVTFAEGGYIRSRDFEDESPIRFRGNGTGEKLRDVCQYGDRAPQFDIRDELLRRLQAVDR